MLRARMAMVGVSIGGVMLVFANGCGGGGGGGGHVSFTGRIDLPSSSQCQNCSSSGAPLKLSALRKDALPEVVTSSTTDAGGNYAVENVRDELAGRNAVIFEVSVSQAAIIGGVESAHEGDNVKTFDVATQVACVASVLLTAGTAPFGDPGCAVRSVCGPGDPSGCIATLDPSRVDDQLIANLEQAASIVADRVTLPDDQAFAACAAIVCTFAGSQPAESSCMNVLF